MLGLINVAAIHPDEGREKKHGAACLASPRLASPTQTADKPTATTTLLALPTHPPTPTYLQCVPTYSSTTACPPPSSPTDPSMHLSTCVSFTYSRNSEGGGGGRGRRRLGVCCWGKTFFSFLSASGSNSLGGRGKVISDYCLR